MVGTEEQEVRGASTLREEASPNRILLTRLGDGLAVESVYYGSGTLCLSTQVGCGRRCVFCASGKKGLVRNLEGGELWAQVAQARQASITPRRLTLSGMGEPLDNAAVVFPFVHDAARAGLPVSLTTTAPSLPLLEEAMALPHNGLMLSLHGGTSPTRRRLIPSGPPLAALLSTFVACAGELSRRRRRKLGINYLMLAGVNDRLEEFRALEPLFESLPELCLHLLEYNAVPGDSGRRASEAAMERVDHWARGRGIHLRRANGWRRQTEGGCGTLALRELGELEGTGT